MRISDIGRDSIPLAVTFPGGAVLNITYAPSRYTVAEMEAIAESGSKDVNRILRTFRDVVLTWDLQDENGADLPVSEPMVDVDGRSVPLSTHIDDLRRQAKANGQTFVRPEGLPDDPLRHLRTDVFVIIFKAINSDQSPGK